MLSVLRAAAPQQQSQSSNETKTKFRNVLGLGALPKDIDSPSRHSPRNSPLTHLQPNLSLSRRSVDTITDLQHNKKKKSGWNHSPDIPLSFDTDVVNVPRPEDMKYPTTPQSVSNSRRMPFRVDGQDGPWTISVAESPHDPSSYSLYVKTSTHNLTLTRMALEIVEMHGKLRDSNPGAKLPHLPIDVSALPPPPPKRKSAFLNTLSRLASPSSKSSIRQASFTRLSAAPSTPSSASPTLTNGSTASTAATPIASPSQEINDPFSSLSDVSTPANGSILSQSSSLPPTNSTAASLAAYLTSIANDPAIRQTRVWKRFVRVRTDDLQSVRVERAIKRVRSDLAAHSGSSSTPEIKSMAQVLGEDAEQRSVNVSTGGTTTEVSSINGTIDAVEDHVSSIVDTSVDDVKEEKLSLMLDLDDEIIENIIVPAIEDIPTETEQDRAQTPQVPKTPVAPCGPTPPAPINTAVTRTAVISSVDDDANGPSTPVPDSATSHARIPRSLSADPSARTSRILYSPSSPLRESHPDGAASSTASITGDDSSISTTGRRRRSRKKRSKSSDPNSPAIKKKLSQRKVAIDDFEMMRVLGKGCAGKVLLVRHKPTLDVYALKAITKRHVLAHQELQHTLTEQAVLRRMAAEGTDPFVVKLWWSFHDKENLFLVMDFHPGGDLATQLARWGRLGRDRARFYAAEIVEGVEGLHAAGVIYRDLKPENILIGADGHIVLTDFGLSKEFPRRTNAITAPPTPSGFRAEFLDGSPSPSPPSPVGTPHLATWGGGNDSTSTFCGTAEYLAPEVIQGLPYSYEVDWWSFGTMLYEMLTGITPFWANNHSDMYYRVLQDELQFPEDRTMDQDTKSLIRGLLQRNPALRMKEPRIKKHPYFSMIDWSHVYYKRYIPPYIPPIDPSNASDTQNFDDTFLDMEPVIKDENENDQTDTDQERQTDTDRTDGEDSVATPSQSRSPSVHPQEDDSVDVFDGYSFKGRHSVILDDDDDDEDGDESGPDESEDEMAGGISSSKPSLEGIIPEDSALERRTSVVSPVQEVPEPKTPEARPVVPAEQVEPIPEVSTPVEVKPEEPVEPAPPSTPVVEAPATVVELIEKTEPVKNVEPVETIEPVKKVEPVKTEAPVLSAPQLPTPTPAPAPAPAPPSPVIQRPQFGVTIKAPVPRQPVVRPPRNRREKSGVAALDRNLSDALDTDGGVTEREEDDDWDFVETNVNEERNGTKATSLFARGVVDRYRMVVFRKSTPRRSTNRRNVSGLSADTEGLASEVESPTPSDKQRRGRTTGLASFRRNTKPKQFLRAKSPPSIRSNNSKTKSLTQSAAQIAMSPSTSSSVGLLTPSPSMGSTLPMSPSLKSKDSAMSVGTPSESSDQSMSGDARGRETVRFVEEEKQKSKGLKKYKEGAEKVLSIFQSPR